LNNGLILTGNERSAFYSPFTSPGQIKPYGLCRPEYLVTLNGASQVYPWLQSFFAGHKALIPKPTFGEYFRIFPDAVFYSDEIGLNTDEIAMRAQSCDVLVLVNPNNPTGSVLPTTWIHALAAEHPDMVIIVDESFIDFSGQSSLLPLLEAHPLSNVILVKSLSKALGIPGLRLGYVYTTNRGFHDYMRTVIPIWNLNSMAENFLEIILKHRPEIQASFAQTITDRQKFAAELQALPLIKKVHPSGGNFLLLSLHCQRDKIQAMTEVLLNRHNIYVKDVSERFGGTEAYLRLAVRLPEENMRLVTCLGRLMDAAGALHLLEGGHDQ
jgi:histidinol-phosphate/aromatic aminotransferase/cobyric acid decarboxylase-like protein